MKDFDLIGAENREHADRTFRIGGKDFTFRAYLAAGAALPLEKDYPGDKEWLEEADTIITTLILEPGQEKAWASVRDVKAKRPISLYEVNQVIRHAIEVTSGRPIVPSSASSESPSAAGTSSTAKSDSAAAA